MSLCKIFFQTFSVFLLETENQKSFSRGNIAATLMLDALSRNQIIYNYIYEYDIAILKLQVHL